MRRRNSIIMVISSIILIIIIFYLVRQGETNVNKSLTQRLIENKTEFVGDNSKVVALVDTIPTNTFISRKDVVLQTSTKPYSITITYLPNDDGIEVANDNTTMNLDFFKHSILLFALIDNVDEVTYVVDYGDIDNIENDAYNFTRLEIEKTLGKDVREYSTNEESLQQLINLVEEMYPMTEN